MTGRVGTRRRMSKRNGVKWCALTAGILLLASISILYAILSSSSSSSSDYNNHHNNNNNDDDDDDDDPLLRDSDPLLSSSDDRIDLLDDLLLSDDSPDEEELLRSLDSEGEPDDTHPSSSSSSSSSSSGFFFDHLSHVIRHSFEIDRWDEYANPFQPGIPAHQPPATLASDDVPVDEEVRMKMLQVGGIEDALLLKQGARASPLRQGWGSWFDAKTDFLRKDKMFRSNFELLNPFNHLLLQDPDAIGLTPLTRGDKILHKAFLSQIKKSKPLTSIQNTTFNHTALGRAVLILQEPKIDQYNNSFTKTIQHSQPSIAKTDYPLTSGAAHRWASFPGLPPYLSFSNFMDSFFRHSKCSFRVFMVWNSPSWMFTIRHQRGLESLLYHHPDACVVIFSETVDLDFFKDFVKHSFKVAVAMPNLEELLQDTPTSVFSSVWHEWRRTKFYSIHYSELIRLAALYKYGGIYLDSDIIVLKPISNFSNSVGMEELSPESSLNGAVMAFTKHSSFLMRCMSEFYSTYDDTLKSWNGAELLTRVAGNFSRTTTDANKQLELKVQPASIFFPISSYDIQRYFFSPQNDSEKVDQDTLFTKIINESYTFHFWNSLTSALVPEPDSLVARILNHYCTHCSDLL